LALRALEPRAARDLASAMARAGAALHDGLALEAALAEARARALAEAGVADAAAVDAAASEAVAAVEEALSAARAQAAELQAVGAALAARSARRRGELERAEKRLATLEAVRPAYMDEYEALEAQLQVGGGASADSNKRLCQLRICGHGIVSPLGSRWAPLLHRCRRARSGPSQHLARTQQPATPADSSRRGCAAATTQVLFSHYAERTRNLAYLEARLESYHAAEAAAMEAEQKRLRKMQRRLACAGRGGWVGVGGLAPQGEPSGVVIFWHTQPLAWWQMCRVATPATPSRP
jgi:hypothetical protein